MLCVSVWSSMASAAHGHTSDFFEIFVEEGATREERVSAEMILVF